MVYDGLLLFAVMFFTSALLMGLFQWLAPSGIYVDPSTLDSPQLKTLSSQGRILGGSLVSINCIVISFLFYGWFWTHGGQTLGMKAWNIYVIKPNGKFMSWPTAGKRYAFAIISWLTFGLGFTWILLSREKLAWHDMFSNTRLVHVPPKK